MSDELETDLFAFLCAKYVQRADDRQKAMGLQYTEAETRDLARTVARWIAARAQGPGEAVADGWVMVPRKPTREMIEAGDDYAERALVRWGTCPDSEGHYTAMIAATPPMEA